MSSCTPNSESEAPATSLVEVLGARQQAHLAALAKGDGEDQITSCQRILSLKQEAQQADQYMRVAYAAGSEIWLARLSPENPSFSKAARFMAQDPGWHERLSRRAYALEIAARKLDRQYQDKRLVHRKHYGDEI